MSSGRLLLVALICVVVSLATLLWLVRNPFEMTRLRNALISSVGAPEDFAWRPGNEPDDFHLETLSPPDEFAAFARSAVPAGTQAGHLRALALARDLTRGSVTQGNPIQSDTRDTYRRIVDNNEGYCSDFTQVFNGLALAAGVPIREWGMSFDGFSGDGHAFSEVFDQVLGKWVFIDTFNSFYMVDPSTRQPLSVLEFRTRLEENDPTLVDGVRFIDADAFGMKDAATAIDYYRRGAAQFFLWFGNDVFTYDRNALVEKAARFGRSVEQLAAIVIGVHPRIRIYPTPQAAPFLAKLSRARWLFGSAFGLGVIGCLSLLAALWRRRSGGRRAASPATT